MDSDCFPVSIVVSLLPSSAEELPHCSKGLEGMLLDGVANVSAIVDFFSFFLRDNEPYPKCSPAVVMSHYSYGV